MVIMHYTIKCSCGSSRSDYNESGGDDRFMNEFNCSHFRSSIYHWSKQGWFLGANAKVRVEFQIYCKKCPSTWSRTHAYWGYSADDTTSH